jgi:hypothetical protein
MILPPRRHGHFWALKMADLLTIKQSVRMSWSMAHLGATRAALWSEHHPLIASGVLYGILAYLGSAVLVGVPGQAIVALMLGGPAALWGFGRYRALTGPQAFKLSLFTREDNGPLCLSEDILSSKIVYCIGIKNEGKRIARSVHVNIDSVEGYSGRISETPLPIFRNPDNSADLQPGDSEYFCVMRRIEGSGGDDGRVVICCHSDVGTPNFSIHELVVNRTMTLSAHSEGAPSITRQIQIASKHQSGATWSLHFKLLPNATEVATRVVDQLSVTGAPRVKKAWARVKARARQFSEFFVKWPSKPELTRERKGLSQLTIRHAVIRDERVDPGTMQAVKDTLLDKGTACDANAREEPFAQSERIRRLLARQARA